MAADSKARLEDIYLPYKPKRRTKAQIAREAGLEPLADALLGDPTLDPQAAAAAFVDADKGVADAAAALDGARAILVERFAEDADLIGELRERMWSTGRLAAKVREGKEEAGREVLRLLRLRRAVHRSCPRTASSPCSAARRRRSSTWSLEPDRGTAEPRRSGRPSTSVRSRHGSASPTGAAPADKWLADTVRWAWRTRILVHLGIDLRMRLWQAAEDEAVRVFAANLRDLLLAAPAGTRADDGPRPGLPHRREGRRRRRHRQGRRHRHHLPARARSSAGTSRSPRWPGWPRRTRSS